jgi:hypothetical protein
MSKEFLITLPKRGIRVIPPAETRQNMERARAGETVLWSDEEKARLLMMRDCNILAKRYPTKPEGETFMQEVNYEWRDELQAMAGEVTEDIVENWKQVAPHKDIAVLLFGSVAKGLVKQPHSTDPSNIDMAVIGNITDAERTELFDLIRPKRKTIQQRILSRCPYLDYEGNGANPGNVGVMIQDVSKLEKDGFEPARRYVASGAFALHDPAGIWTRIESRAIDVWNKKRTGKTLSRSRR